MDVEKENLPHNMKGDQFDNILNDINDANDIISNSPSGSVNDSSDSEKDEIVIKGTRTNF